MQGKMSIFTTGSIVPKNFIFYEPMRSRGREEKVEAHHLRVEACSGVKCFQTYSKKSFSDTIVKTITKTTGGFP
jgi:hypothetical protein